MAKPGKPPTPKQPRPWDILPRPTKGAADEKELYVAVGMALTAWELAETALADIFTLLVGAPEISPPRLPAIRAYGAVVGFASRADMVDAASEGFFDYAPRASTKDAPEIADFKKLLRADLKELMKEMRLFATRRNDIAHGIVSGGGRHGYFLYPPLYNARKHPTGKDGLTVHEAAAFCYGAQEVLYYRAQFMALAERLNGLANRFRELGYAQRT